MSDDTTPAKPEFRGVTLPRGGQFKLTNVTIPLDGDASIEYQVRSELWHHWLLIAEGAAVACRAARDANSGPDDGPAFGRLLESEMRHAMLAFCASAAALEAFTASLVVIEPKTCPPRPKEGKKTPAYAKTFETIRRGFTLLPSGLPGLRDGLRQMFELRNAALHPPSGFVTPGLHPAFNVAIDTRMLQFRVENAEQAPLLARHVIRSLVTSKGPRFKTVREWAKSQAALLEPEELARDVEPRPIPPTDEGATDRLKTSVGGMF